MFYCNWTYLLWKTKFQSVSFLCAYFLLQQKLCMYGGLPLLLWGQVESNLVIKMTTDDQLVKPHPYLHEVCQTTHCIYLRPSWQDTCVGRIYLAPMYLSYQTKTASSFPMSSRYQSPRISKAPIMLLLSTVLLWSDNFTPIPTSVIGILFRCIKNKWAGFEGSKYTILICSSQIKVFC